MATIITYDVPSKHTDIKKAMFALGYTDKFVSDGRYVYLPNTTVYHQTKSPVTARTELQTVCTRLNVHLERCIATDLTNWSAIYGEPF